MTRATLVGANLRRRLRRTILTILGLGVALFLFVTLQTVLRAFQTFGEVGSESRLVVSSKLGIIFPLPLAYASRIRSVDGVQRVAWASWFGGVYQDPQNFFASFAVDPENYLTLYPEMAIPAEQREAFLADRTGAIVGARLMERFGWQVGQTVVLQGTIYPGEHRFTVRGVYEAARRGFDESSFLFHHRYLEEIARSQGQDGMTGWYVLGISNPDLAPTIASTIDSFYENSASPTRSQTENAFNLSFVGLYGNIGFFMNAIGMAVVFAILLVAANTMAMSARERFGEIAVLKTLGFTDLGVAGMVVAEALVIALLGLAVGLGGAMAVFNVMQFDAGGFLPGLRVMPATIALAGIIAILIGLVSGSIPAFQSARLRVVDALRFVA